MGIVINQTLKNIATTYAGFVFGAVNTLYLYVHFMEPTYYGLIIFLLSTANLLSPLFSFGAQHALLKYHSSFKEKVQKDKLISTMLWIPLVVLVLFFAIYYLNKTTIIAWLIQKNTLLATSVLQLLLVAVFMAYFEVFYALARVAYQSVFGNFLKEVFVRVVVTGALIALHFHFLNESQFITVLVVAYFVRVLIMAFYALRVTAFKFTWQLPYNSKAILNYMFFIVLAFSVAAIFFDIDKFMIPMYQSLKSNAYYSVAIFIAMVIAVPSRAMRQIIWPLTAKALNENDKKHLLYLYRESAINLLIISGLIYLLILLNIQDLYSLLPAKYSGGLYIVFMIGLSKLYEVSLGNNDAILYNSNAYKSLVFFGVLLVVLMVFLNNYFIPKYGIEGAALATLITMFIYNTLKLLFVKYKFGIQPYTWQTFYVFLVIKTLLFVFLFLPMHLNPIANIIVRSLVVVLLYVGILYLLKVTPTINKALVDFLKKK